MTNVPNKLGSTFGSSKTYEGEKEKIPEPSFAPTAIPTLTIVYHPNLVRIGQRLTMSALLAGRQVTVARHRPVFLSPSSEGAEPLNDPFLSREPIRFSSAPDDGVTLVGNGRTTLLANGEPVVESRTFHLREVINGVVLELAERVVLLLHFFTPSEDKDTKRFGLIGDSSGITRVREEVRRVADLDLPVLLRGETGTGKELVARAIHEARPKPGPFISVNLGALPANLASSELFGSVRGAYTGSIRSQDGYFRKADGGTLFLDEVGEAPAEVQVMLLRVLETGEIYPVGAQTPLSVRTRLIAATDANLEEMVESGQFRAPLLHRLAGYELFLPPLRNRRDDIGRLLFAFLREELNRVDEMFRLQVRDPGDTPWMPAPIVARLIRHDWPGNVRQLRNLLRQIVVGNRGLPSIRLGAKIAKMLETCHPSKSEPDRAVPQVKRRKPSDISEEELVDTMRGKRWDVNAASRQLNISRSSLYVLIKNSSRVHTAGDLAPESIQRCFAECDGNLEAMVDRLEVSISALRRRVKELGLG